MFMSKNLYQRVIIKMFTSTSKTFPYSLDEIPCEYAHFPKCYCKITSNEFPEDFDGVRSRLYFIKFYYLKENDTSDLHI